MTAASTATRRDGKPRRKPRLGLPPGVPRQSANAELPAPSWHELVQAGPKGDPKKKLARAERVHHGKLIKQEGDGVPRRYLREMRRANGMLGEFHRSIVTRSPQALPAVGAAVGMAKIRAHRTPTPDGAPRTRKQRREAQLAAAVQS